MGAAGQKWKIAPQLGDLTSVSSGITTNVGAFSVEITADGSGAITAFSFVTPTGTTGDVVLPQGTTGTLTDGSGQMVTLTDGVATGLSGGSWTLG